MKTHEHTTEIEVSVVMPCLNEEGTVGTCIEKALVALKTHDILGEIIVADNGSTNDSVEIAKRFGAHLVHQPRRGYGASYLSGFAASRRQYIIMRDSDDTYDFTDLERSIIKQWIEQK